MAREAGRLGWRRKDVVHEDKRSYRVTIERYVYVSAHGREDAKWVASQQVAPGELVTGAVEDFW